jgi:abortive infection bacteriophage resistance protein
MKPFLTIEQQIHLLREDKRLLIADKDIAAEQLKSIGYFALIGGYKTPFKDSTTGLYKTGTRFEDIFALYEFDENQRELFLRYILRIERRVRTLLAYYFCEKYGEDQKQYLNPENYDRNPKRAADVASLIHRLDMLANRVNDYHYIVYQRATYGNVPLWVLVNGITMGTLSKFYQLSSPGVKSKIAKDFPGVNEKQLGQFLKLMTKFRNVCAHNERLFSYHTRNTAPNMPIHEKLSIPLKSSEYIYGKRDLFAIVIAFKYLMSKKDFRSFNNQLTRIIYNYTKITTAIQESELNRLMGFPPHWEKITRYK